MRNTISAFTAVLCLGLTIQASCQKIIIDHVIVVVNDLETSIEGYKSYGFTIKEGSLHNNGLKNAHIKFRNNSSLELMSINTTPVDDLSKTYHKLLEKGEGGVFLALSGLPTKLLKEKLRRLNIPFSITQGSSWNYITFDQSTGLEHIFFIDYLKKTENQEELYNHPNMSEGINSILIEGGTPLISLLEGLGLNQIVQDNQTDVTYFTATGKINIISITPSDSRPRIKGISFTGKGDFEILKLTF